MAGSLLVISGPSGSGKSSIIKEVLKNNPNAIFSISTTTRELREGEKHGVNYFFTDKDSFQKDIKEGAFLEWANVHGNFYGTSIKQITSFLQEGKLVILDIDVQGFMIAKKKLGRFITSLFLTTKSENDLRNRLISRGTDAHEVVETRLKNAVSEMDYIDEYEYLVVNDDFQKALSETLCIAASAGSKSSLVDKGEFTSLWGQKLN